jgi:putative ABC transport system permease protein
MIKNYLLIAFRTLYRNSFYSLINIVGLSVGIACSILILLWVADELSFNRFHQSYDRIHEVMINQEFSGEVVTIQTAPFPLAAAIKNTSAGIKRIVLTNHGEGDVLTVGETKINKMGLAVTEDFLKMFSFEFVAGDPNTALNEPASLVINESTAKALFGDKDALGQYILFAGTREVKVTGVMKDIPDQSTFQFDYFMPFAQFEATNEWVRDSRERWHNNSFNIYTELQEGVNVADVEASIKDLVKKNDKEAPTAQVMLHPMSKWRLYTDFKNGKAAGGMIDYVTMFSAIAVFIIVIACINFMNLATARSEKRAREVGIRKSVGSRRKQLIFQFLGESILITFIGFLLALMLVEVLLPAYNLLVQKQLAIDYSNSILWICAVSIVLLTGVIAGSYPAFYLSAFQPATVLKGKAQTSRSASTPRKVLVTLQFGFSIFLIIGTLVVYQQVMHVKNREIGYDRENLMLIWTNNEIEKNYPAIKEELKRTGVVKAVCKSSAPITRIFSSVEVEWAGKDPNEKVGFISMATEYDFAETMGVKMLEGRDFSPEFPSDSSGVIVNKAAVDLMGLKDPIGATIRMWGDEWNIIGVTENIIMGSPYQPVDPTVMVFIPGWSSTINVRLDKTNDLQGAVAKVEDIFKKMNPMYPMSWRFADVEFERKFSSINLISRLAGIFATLAILITCLGLFGLAAFTAEQRRKELGIRKVLGATASGLVLLMSKDFSRLILIAFVISSPIAWWFLNNFFLEQYPYRITIAWWVIPAAGVAALSLAMVIVGAQAFRAANNNPVDSLRSE